MFKKPIVRWLSVLLIVVAVIGITVVGAKEPAPKTTGLVLEDMPIVLPAKATEVEKTAAKELQHYLREITGSASSIITESVPVGSGIYLGATRFAEENNVTYTDQNGMGEGWAIKAVGSNLVITGGVERGALYGVYHLLEDELGVHWWNYWEEHVPEMEDAVLPLDFDRSGEPVFADRSVYSKEDYNTLYNVRNRMNGWGNYTVPAFGSYESFTRPYAVHTFNRFYGAFYTKPSTPTAARWTDAINPDGIDWFIEHPEWFAWSDARQERISYGQLCLSNEELVADMIEKMKIAIALSYEDADLAGKKRPAYISVTPNDMGGLCECDLCDASTAAHGPSGHLLRFVNKIAEGIEKVYPEITVETLAYWQYFEAPLDDTVPRDNVVVRLASSDVNTLRDLDHWTNEQVKDRLYAWSNIVQPGQLWYWNYGIHTSADGLFPSMFNYGPDMRKMDEAGCFGVFYELQKFNSIDFWDLKSWVLAKTMEDPYQDDHELIKTFTYGYYGEAAGELIYDYLVYIDGVYDDCDEAITFSTPLEPDWLSAAEIKTGLAYFDKAVEATKQNKDLTEEERELFLNRIAAARIGIDTQILLNYDEYVQEMAAANDPDRIFGLSKREVGQRMVRAAQWLGNMELEEDYTGIQGVGKRGSLGNPLVSTYSEYADEVDQATGELVDRPPIPEQIYQDHPGISDAHIYDYTNATFWNASSQFGWAWIGDSLEASYEGGTSVLLDHGVAAREKYKNFGYYTFSETKPFKACFAPAWYLGDPIQNDGQWHLYRAEDVVAVRSGSDRFTFWDEALRFEFEDMEHLMDDPVDVYVSMKVTGDPSGEDPNNYAKVWVDRVIIVEDCTCYDVEYTGSIPATCESNEILTGMCPVCGQLAKKEVGGTKLPHKFTGKYVYDAKTNTYTNNCSVCGEVVYDDFHAELPAEVIAAMEAEGATMDMIHDYRDRDFGTAGCTQNVSDSDSVLGAACLYDVNTCGSLGHFKIDNNRGIYTWGNKIPSSQVPKAKDIITDGEYHIYRMDDVDLFADGGTMFYLFDWSFQMNFSKLEHLKGRTVDMFLSFKVDGELNYDTPGQMPKYYIDRVVILENCPDHMADHYEYDADRKLYYGQCRTCGLEITSTYPVSLLEDMDAGKTNESHIDDYDASMFLLYGELKLQEDKDAHNGKTVYAPNKFSGGDVVFSFVNTGEFMRFSGAELKANDGKGYKFYKADDVTVPNAEVSLGYMWSLGWHLQLKELWGYFDTMMGKTLDIYVSFKVEGADLYVDRFIVVDNCGNHVDMDEAEKIASATCYRGEVYRGTCSVCTRVSERELIETRLPHKFGTYVLDPVTGQQTAECQNDGCDETKTVDGLPQVVMDRLNEQGMGMEHVHDYTASDFILYAPSKTATDATSTAGTVVKLTAFDYQGQGNPALFIGRDLPINIYAADGKSYVLGTIPKAELGANAGKGYVVYEFEDVKLPDVAMNYLHLLEWKVQNEVCTSELKALRGETVDMYLSMKIEGNPVGGLTAATGPTYYIDRLIFVDNCDNYELEYKLPDDVTCADENVNYIALCPVCGKEFTKPGASASGHSFTKYIRINDQKKDEYVAECDFGCGATDVKYDPKLTLEEKLPAELDVDPAHIIMSYSIDEFQMLTRFGDAWFDVELGRPVGVREYDTTVSSALQYALNTSSGIGCVMYKAGYPQQVLGSFSGAEIRANADDGKYHLYALKGVVPLTYKDYNYMFLFSDWAMQLPMIDADLLLKGYHNKMVDLYLYMKVDGDPSAATVNKPIYYVDQFIVVESCTPDDTWVVTKEATCVAAGEMTGTCTVCGDTDATVSIPKLPHTYTNPYQSKAPTCVSNAYEYGTCTVCGTTDEQEVPGTKLEHSFSNYVKQEDGVTEIAYCDNGCGERHIRNSVSNGSNLDLPENIQQILPVIGKPASHGVSFSDIKSSDWYFDAVKEAVDNKLINGVTPTEFRPNETLTVAQAVKLASAYHEMNYTGDVTLTNGAGNWYSSYVDYAVENSIIGSDYASMSTAEMNKPIDRSEFVAIFEKAMDEGSLTGYNTVADNAIPDVKANDANADAIYKFYRAGILTGSDGKGTFNPHSPIKRSEVATILSRMYNENIRQAITLN